MNTIAIDLNSEFPLSQNKEHNKSLANMITSIFSADFPQQDADLHSALIFHKIGSRYALEANWTRAMTYFKLAAEKYRTENPYSSDEAALFNDILKARISMASSLNQLTSTVSFPK